MTESKRLIAFYLLAFGWSWGLWGPAVAFDSGVWQVPGWLPTMWANGSMAAWGPLIAAVIVTLATGGRAGLADLGRRMIKARIGGRKWLLGFALLPGLLGLVWLLAGALGADIPPSEAFAQPVSIPIAFVYILLLGGPLQEEAGWRGIATEGLQRRLPPLLVALIVGGLWGLWHLPLFHLPSAGIYYEQPFWGLFFSTVLLSVILGWFYNVTGGSLLAVMVMHASFNWANYLFPVLDTDLGGMLYFAGLVLICAALIWRDGGRLGRL